MLAPPASSTRAAKATVPATCEAAVRAAIINKRAFAESVRVLHAIQDVCLDPAIALA